jgi:hypothetical protein
MLRLLPGIVLLAVLALPPASARAGAPAPQVNLRICVQVDAQSGATGSKQTAPIRLSNPDEVIYIKSLPEVTERDLVGIEPYSGVAGETGAIFHFSSHAAIELNNTTLQNEGRILVVLLDGRPIYSPVIDAPLNSGDFVVPRGVLPAEMTELQKVIKENLQQTMK